MGKGQSIAKQLYKDLQKNHTEFRFKDSGLVIDTNHPFLGASPDGITSFGLVCLMTPGLSKDIRCHV